MPHIEKLLSMKKLPDKKEIDITYDDFVKLYWKCKGLLINEKRNNDFWQATNENLSLAYDKLNRQEKELSEIYRKIKKDLDLAASIQMRMFPKRIPELENYSLAADCKMARQSGGDFYDVIQLDNGKSLFIIGDVCGKGMPASLYMSSCINIIRALVEEMDPSGENFLTKILEKVNKLLYNIMSSDSFVTLFLVLLDPESHNFSYISLGHMPAVVYNPVNKSLTTLDTEGIVCGILEPSSFAEFLQEKTIEAKKGSYYILYTDGITDQINKEGENLDETFEALLTGLSGKESAGEVLSHIMDRIAAFTGDIPQFDDVTLLCFKREK